MNIERAREILNSGENFRVLHQGWPVWIEGVSRESHTAMVKPLTGQGNMKEVPVAELVEG